MFCIAVLIAFRSDLSECEYGHLDTQHNATADMRAVASNLNLDRYENM